MVRAQDTSLTQTANLLSSKIHIHTWACPSSISMEEKPTAAWDFSVTSTQHRDLPLQERLHPKAACPKSTPSSAEELRDCRFYLQPAWRPQGTVQFFLVNWGGKPLKQCEQYQYKGMWVVEDRKKEMEKDSFHHSHCKKSAAYEFNRENMKVFVSEVPVAA